MLLISCVQNSMEVQYAINRKMLTHMYTIFILLLPQWFSTTYFEQPQPSVHCLIGHGGAERKDRGAACTKIASPPKQYSVVQLHTLALTKCMGTGLRCGSKARSTCTFGIATTLMSLDRFSWQFLFEGRWWPNHIPNWA